MKYRWDKKYLYWGITTFAVVVASVCFYYLLFHGSTFSKSFRNLVSITMPIIDGLVVAYLLTPVMNMIENKCIIPLWHAMKLDLNDSGKKKIRFFSIILTLIVVCTLIYGFFSMVIPQLIKSVQSIILQFPIYINNFSIWITKLLSDNPDIESFANDMLNQYSADIEKWLNQSLLPQMNTLLKSLSLSLLSFVKSLWNLIIGFIISIYLLSSKELFSGQCKKVVYAFFETKTANSIIDNLRYIHKTFSGFLGGKILDSIIIGIICFVCTSFIGTPYPVLISVIVGVTNIIPFFGPYIGAVPSAILILLVNPLQCLYFIIFILILQQFDGNFLGPKILGNSTGMSGFWVIFAITLFGGLWGVFGMLIGVPTFAVLLTGFKAVCNHMLTKKGLSTTTSLYTEVHEICGSEFIAKDSAIKKEENRKSILYFIKQLIKKLFDKKNK
ncbi:MAG: AI-2E family transporter [Lachnospiraceae bacterium]|nr:AI-2E family transporter [Lachnospiraceae bacterium]